MKDALSPHIVVPLSGLVPYTQLRMGRRGDWEGCFRNRSIATDVLIATKGHTLSQPYLMAEIKKGGGESDKYVRAMDRWGSHRAPLPN